MLGTSKKGKNPKFEDLKFFENLEIRSLESYFLLGANKVSVWGLGKKKNWSKRKYLWNFSFKDNNQWGLSSFLLNSRENIIKAKCMLSISKTSRRALFKGCNVGRVQVIKRKDIKGSKTRIMFPQECNTLNSSIGRFFHNFHHWLLC